MTETETVPELNVKSAWKQIAKLQQNTAENTFRYCVARAVKAWTNDKTQCLVGLVLKSFTPISNKVKIDNGMTPWQAVTYAFDRVYVTDVVYPDKFPNFVTENFTADETEQYRNLIKEFKSEIKKLDDKFFVYIMVRTDLSPEQQVVQAAHVTAKLAQYVPKRVHDMSKMNFCVFGVANLGTLVDDPKENYVMFYEPDISQYTTVAYFPMRQSFAKRKDWFKDYELLTFPKMCGC